MNYSASGYDSTAIINYNNALAIYKKLNDEAGMGRILHNIGISYYNRSDFFDAKVFQEKSKDIFVRLNDR